MDTQERFRGSLLELATGNAGIPEKYLQKLSCFNEIGELADKLGNRQS